VNINPETAMTIGEINAVMDYAEVLLKDLTDDEVALVVKAIGSTAVMKFATSALEDLRSLSEIGDANERINLMVQGMVAMLTDVAVYGNQLGVEAYEMVTLGSFSDLED